MDGLTAEDPHRVGGYRLLGRLGTGGMGRVYLARSPGGRTVAVKFVRPELARESDFRRRFRQEVEAARRVDSAWTAPVLDADTDAEVPWVATGYIAGPSLRQIVEGTAGEGHGPLPERSVRALAYGLARALQDIHSAGLIHRDLKPSNVLITIDGPRVIDFGLTRALEAHSEGGLTHTGLLVGSPGFMSPEQMRGKRITPASDVFGMGSVLAYAATGRAPFGNADSGIHAVMFRVAEEEPELSDLSQGPLRELVSECLAKDPAMRPALTEIAARTRPEDTGDTASPWLPAALIARLGRHAAQLLDTDVQPLESSGYPPVHAEPETVVMTSHQAPPSELTAPPRKHLGWRAPLIAAGVAASVAAAIIAVPRVPAVGTPESRSAVPAGYVGAWTGPVERDGAFTGTYRRFVISQGEVGEVVATSISLGATYQCKSEGKLVSAEDGLRISTKVVRSLPEGRCSALDGHVLTLRPDNTLSWNAGGSTATLRKIEPGSEAVPDKYLGTWEQKLSNGSRRRMTVKQAAVGSPIISSVADVNGKHCEAHSELFSVDGMLMVGPSVVTKSEPAGECRASSSSTLRLNSGSELYREFHADDKQPRAYTRVG